MKAVDTNGDGKIQYNGTSTPLTRPNGSTRPWREVLPCPWTLIDGKAEFRIFVEETEKELRTLFDSIDRDHNGQLDKAELQAAFSRAGLAVPSSKLDRFFAEVDTDHNGTISFDEWR